MLQIWALEGIPEITPGSDLVAVVAEAVGSTLQGGDILIVTSKIVSKAEGRMIAADDREDAITAETVRLVASRTSPGGHTTRIVENKLGIVSAAAGVDASNTPHGTGIGQRLFDAVVDGEEQLYLWVAEDNPRAHRFYARNGFQLDGAAHTEPFLGETLTEVRFVR